MTAIRQREHQTITYFAQEICITKGINSKQQNNTKIKSTARVNRNSEEFESGCELNHPNWLSNQQKIQNKASQRTNSFFLHFINN